MQHALRAMYVSPLMRIGYLCHRSGCFGLPLRVCCFDANSTISRSFSQGGPHHHYALDKAHPKASSPEQKKVRSWKRSSKAGTVVGVDLIYYNPTTSTRHERATAEARAHLPPLSPDAVQLQERLWSGSADPFETLKQKIDDGKASLDIIRVCLNAAGGRVFGLKRSSRPAVLSDAQRHVSSQVLSYLWTDFQIWRPLVQHDYRTCFLLCYFAVAEGLDEYVERWIRADTSSEERQYGVVGKDAHFWRGELLKGLVDAHMILATDSSADRAIRCLMEVNTWRTTVTQRKSSLSRRTPEAKAHFANCINLFPAFIIMKGRLSKGWCRKTSPALYEQFQAELGGFVGTKASRYDTAGLALRHPTRPDAQPMLLWLREFLDTDQAAQMLENERLKTSLTYAMHRTILLLEASGKVEDAEWVVNQHKRIFGGKAHLTFNFPSWYRRMEGAPI